MASGSGARVIHYYSAYQTAVANNDSTAKEAALLWDVVGGSAPVYNGSMQQIGTVGGQVKFNFGQYMSISEGPNNTVRYGYVFGGAVNGWMKLSYLSGADRALLEGRAPIANPPRQTTRTLETQAYNLGGVNPDTWSGFKIYSGSGVYIGDAVHYLMRPASNNNVNILYGLPNDGSFVDANGVGVYGGFAVDTLPSLGSGVAPAQFQRYTGIASRSIDTRNSAGVHRRMEFYFGEITKGSSAYGINTYGWVAKDALTAV